MIERWVCKRCFADNEESNAACQRCGLVRGAEATPADQAGWSAQVAHARPTDSWTKWLRLWWIPAIAIVLVVGYVASARRDSQGNVESGGTLTVTDLRVGDCFDFADASAPELTEVDAIPCNEAHANQIFHATHHETATFPTSVELDAIIGSLCLVPFESFVGLGFERSELFIGAITPSADGFAEGDRSYLCYLYHPSPLTSTMQGAHR